MGIDLRIIVHAILEEYELPREGTHGVSHWARVLENGLRLAAETGANVEIIKLFAVFHDSRRVNESLDPDHGRRGADFAAEIQGRLFDLVPSDFKLLYRACAGHTHERTHPNITIQTCWDADRLDLGRVGIRPHPSRLCTEPAKRQDTIQRADRRAGSWVVPELVAGAWQVELKNDPGRRRTPRFKGQGLSGARIRSS